MSRARQPTALQRMLAEVDRVASTQLGVDCRTRFGRAVDGVVGGAGGAAVRVEKQPSGRYAYRLDGERLRGFDGLDRGVLDGLRDAQRRLRDHDTLRVTLGAEQYRIRLYPVDESHPSHYGGLAGREVSLPPADEPHGAPTAQEHEQRLADYLSILKAHQAPLESFLDGLNEHVPAPLARLELVTQITFSGDEGVAGRELKLLPTLGCNQRCLFCCAREQQKPFSAERLRTVLAELRQEAAADLAGTRLFFSGGEPTLHPELVSLLRHARDLGFPWLGLQTNGVRLSNDRLLDELLEVGLQQVIFSMHSHRPEVYDRLTGTTGQFPRAVKGLRRLLEHPVEDVLVNIVINRLNVDELPDYVDFVAGLPHADTTHLAVMPSIVFMDNDNGHWSELAVSHAEVVLALREAVARQPDLFVPMQGDCFLPFCLGADHPELAALAPARRADSPTVYLDRRAPGPVPDRVRVKHEGCRACVLDARCGGVCGEYARTQGLGELRPL